MLLDNAKNWLDQNNMKMGDLKGMAESNTEEDKNKLMEFAKAHGVDVNPEDDAKMIWEKIHSKM